MDGQVTDMEGHVRALGAAISRREWSEVEAAHAALRDRARIGAVSDAELSAMERAIERMGWPEIHGFEAELFRGQDIHEDAGGYLMRAIPRCSACRRSGRESRPTASGACPRSEGSPDADDTELRDLARTVADLPPEHERAVADAVAGIRAERAQEEEERLADLRSMTDIRWST